MRPTPARVLYDLLKPIVAVGLRWYYRRLSVTGMERVPRDGPILLAVNHPNALVDALAVGVSVPRSVGFTAKATLFANPLAARALSTAGVVPLRRAADEAAAGAAAAADPSRNSASFDAVAHALARGAAIVVFPEGKSHDDPRLAPLRTGLARMALHAAHTFGVRGLRIVPIGLLFEQKEQPRSRVLLQVGEAIDVDAVVAGQLSVATLTQLVNDRLESVTLNFASAHDADRLQQVGSTLAALLEPVSALSVDHTTLGDTLRVVRRLDRARVALADRHDAALDQRAQQFEVRVRAFRARLDALGLDVHDVAIRADTPAGLRFAAREVMLASLMLPIGLWGRVTHVVPMHVARSLALRNVRTRDEPAMNTLVLGLVLVLGAYVVQTVGVALVFGPWWALGFAATLVPSASSDLRYGDRRRRARARMRAYFLFRRDPALQQALIAEADHIRTEAGALERLVIT